jgi:hypothetical protein
MEELASNGSSAPTRNTQGDPPTRADAEERALALESRRISIASDQDAGFEITAAYESEIASIKCAATRIGHPLAEVRQAIVLSAKVPVHWILRLHLGDRKGTHSVERCRTLWWHHFWQAGGNSPSRSRSSLSFAVMTAFDP